MIYANEDKYEGQFKDGKRDGHGVRTNKDGSSYIGEYQNEKPHG